MVCNVTKNTINDLRCIIHPVQSHHLTRLPQVQTSVIRPNSSSISLLIYILHFSLVLIITLL